MPNSRRRRVPVSRSENIPNSQEREKIEGPLASSCRILSQLQRVRPTPKLIVIIETAAGQPLAETGRQRRTDHQAGFPSILHEASQGHTATCKS